MLNIAWAQCACRFVARGPLPANPCTNLALADSAQSSWLLCKSHTHGMTGVRGVALAHQSTWDPKQELAFQRQATTQILSELCLGSFAARPSWTFVQNQKKDPANQYCRGALGSCITIKKRACNPVHLFSAEVS